MDTKVNFTIVGLFIVVLTAVLIGLIVWLTALKNAEQYNTYIVYVHEEVSGLSVQAAVRYNGVTVGYVSDITLNPKDPQQVILELKIQQGTPITTSTIATFSAQGITGIDYIGLKALTAEAPPLKAKPGEKYPVIPSEPSLLVKLSTALQEITTTVKNLSISINQIFDTENRLAISESLQNISKVTATLAQNTQNYDATMAAAKTFMQNGAKASQQLPEIMTQLEQMLTAVKHLATNFSAAGESATLTMRDTQVAVQSVSQQLLPSAQALLTRLANTAINLQGFTFELERNPSILIRGKYPSPPGPGEQGGN